MVQGAAVVGRDNDVAISVVSLINTSWLTVPCSLVGEKTSYANVLVPTGPVVSSEFISYTDISHMASHNFHTVYQDMWWWSANTFSAVYRPSWGPRCSIEFMWQSTRH